jgi:NAD(P)-dependent dehydrogenase (short-subunit alcohol dehydrogenase family)
MSVKKIVLVTGASGAIGRTLCQGFKDQGWIVVATDKIESTSVSADYFIEIDLDLLCCDDEYYVKKINNLKQILSGRLSVLINNAALQILSPVNNISLQDWQRTLNINLTAPFLLSQELLGELTAVHGSIINISSIHTRLTKPNFIAYSASKSGLLGLTRSLAVEVGDKVRVNSISPAAINTQMLRDGFVNCKDGLEDLSNYHPSKSIGSPMDVFDAALYLANGGKFINGMNITLDGAISSRLHDPI